ncbi:MAG TPA: type II toxin-antitoxin system RelE/ParE family toxin [Gallionellaceae bacterium]|nr:type II toxin-antitoxin system RelE/ParE family toxin [Gallionellaceae bacterium]
MANKLEITPEAERDIFAIASNIQLQDSVASAMRVVSELKIQLNNLVALPGSGREGGCDGTREVVITGMPFIAVYKKDNDLITIVRVLYGADE